MVFSFHCHTISSLTHQNDMNITLPQLCRDGRLKDAVHILLTTNSDTHSSLRSSTCLQLLQTSVANNALPQANLLHSLLNRIRLKFGPSTHKFLQDRLIHMYANCGSLANARDVFDCMIERDPCSWNIIISGYQRHGFPRQALTLFHQMQLSPAVVQPDQFTFPTVLKACAKLGDLQHGLYIHKKLFKSGFLSDVVAVSALVDMYAKCGSQEKARELFDKMNAANTVSWTAMIAGYAQNGYVERARELFDKMPHRNAVSWNAMIAGYAQNGFSEKALETFMQMQLSGANPDSATFASILSGCATMGALEEGMNIHQKVVESGFSSNVVVVSALIDMYAKCGRVRKAHELFDKMHDANTVSWTAMIAGYAQNGVSDKALETFKQMQLSGVKSNSATFASILPACSTMGALEEAMDIHQRVVENGFSSNVVVVNALIDMYAKCGRIHKAHELFDKMHDANTVSWTAMIAGYTQNGFYEKALEAFKQMQLSGVKPDSATFASVLPACATMGVLEEGMDIHQRLVENGFLSNVVVVSALIDMYAKCGRIHKARELFDKMRDADTISWTAMIGGYAMHGYSKDALKLFDLMHLGTNPDNITFVCVLLACSHAGLVDEGCKYFNSMNDSYCIIPGMNHYTCIVDLLGRAGYLEEALNFTVKMPINPELGVWMCLLGACRSHKNVVIGEFVAKILLLLEPQNASSYVLLSNIYAEVGSWDDVQRLRTLSKDRGINKTPGCSWIEVDKRVHAFLVGDRSHPQTQEIYGKLEKLSSEMKAAGYTPNTIPVLRDVEADDKELLLCQHSEKLAIAFGLLKTTPGTIIRVVKNIRVCDDCHTATKFISKIVARDIVVRDANRFHHFKHGECSCRDYW